ncbi:MAG: ammonium transporter, partial [Chloroflexi bacterium]|nr:ammonium transporter [Chloroflexota bacterium]
FFYGGLVRSKSVVGVIMHSFMAMGIVGVVWVLWGYSLAFGPDWGSFIGKLDYVGLRNVSAVEAGPWADTIPHMTFVIFQGMFAIITPALITGAFVERMKFSAYIIFTIAWVTIVYAPMAHWVWGGGWLGGFGVMDFAGGAVVHMNSGLAALAAAMIVGRRLRHGQEPMDSHNVPFVILGASLLWFGWFGFNAGSALTAGGSASLAFMVTNTAAAAASLTWVGLSWHFSGKPSAVGAAAGAVAGLVAITPAAGFVGPMPAIVIGMGAGAFCFGAMFLIRRLRIDDSLDVFAVHGIGGTWGALATGIFVAVGTAGAFDLGDIDRLEQVGKQIVGIAVTWGWSFTLTAAILLAIKHTIGLRVDDTTEEQGLDIAIHGDEAYPGTFH